MGRGEVVAMTEPIVAAGVNGQVSFDGSWVTITRKGMLARATVGKGEKRIPISLIAAVQWKPPGPLVRGFIAFTVPGGNESRSRFGHQTTDAAKDENAVVISSGQKEEFEALRAAVEAAISAHHAPPVLSQVRASASVGDELAKLVALRDQGVLNGEEFDAAKARLLAQ